MSSPISIVIPTLNEQQELRSTLCRLRSQHNGEIIIADGGSTDETVRIARNHGATVVRSQPGRGRQLNAGAAKASRSTLLFLHADTHLPRAFDTEITRILARSGVSAGAFRLCIDADRLSLRFIAVCANMRSRMLQMPYGDQALFMHRAVFVRAGGFPEYAAMEDYCLVRQLRRLGRIAISRRAVATSARRWERRGPWRTTILNQFCVLAYQIGVDPERIARWRRSGPKRFTAPAAAPDREHAQCSTATDERTAAYTR